jgi:exopolysaccharide production protein ExoQ
MSPSLALLLCLLFILYLFYVDLRRADSPSPALWVPIIWMFLIGSRHVSSWLNIGPQFETAADFAEGSPIDRAVFFCLIFSGIVILVRRKIDWEHLLIRNGWVVLYLLYCLASVTWTDEPLILLKRWVKDLGFPIMALVILTEEKPYEAIGVVLRRMAFIMLPLSIVFIKYFPDLGRWYRVYGDGAETFTGVGRQKNDLGLICLMIGIYMGWEVLHKHKATYPTFVRQNKIIFGLLAAMLAWLLYKSNSQTSLACLAAAGAVLLLGRWKRLAGRPDALLGLLFCAVAAVAFLDQAVGLKEYVLALLGRRPDLTTRTDIWRILLGFNTDPVVGVGFWSFWTGARQEEAWRLIGEKINQAHNGYLEQYLNLGYIGVAFIVIIMFSGILKIRRHLSLNHADGMLRLSFLAVAVMYNYTEAAFYGSNNVWMLLLLACMEGPRLRQGRTASNQSPRRTAAPVGMKHQPMGSRAQH